MSTLEKAQELQLDVDNALATLGELRDYLYRQWLASQMDSPRELHIHGLRVSCQEAINRLNKHATVKL